MKKYQALIVGAGFSGLCMGIKLKQAGFQDFVILEKADALGGTWRENTYPGAECDIPSALYSYSFELSHEWQYKWSGQEQILKYQQDTAEKYGLLDHLLFDHNVTQAKFDQSERRWLITCESGRVFCVQHLISAVGQLHIPAWPEFKGMSEYQGNHFHSAEWDHSAQVNGQRVAVVGNAASAVQFIPELAEHAQQLTVFQRSPNWILPKVDRPYTAWEQRLSRKLPWLARINRFSIWALGEWGVLPALKGGRISKWIVRGMCRRNLHRHIKDPSLRKVLTPAYSLGAKRILFSDHYYPTLVRDNVDLQTAPIKAINSEGILLNDGKQLNFDTIIYATGFQTNPFLASISVSGIADLKLSEHWQNGAHAYLGLTTHGFPNMFMMYGPNTNLGHTSIILMIEAQARYIVRCMREMRDRNCQQFEVKREVEAGYNRDLQKRLNVMAFNQIDASWYKDGDRVTNNWPGGTCEYERQLRLDDWSAYTLS